MKILFIGGTGNISAECAALLHQRGHEIGVISRGQRGVPAEFRSFIADRNDPAALRSALRSALGGEAMDVVINFLGYELGDVQADYEWLKKNPPRQYLFISSTAVYEKPPRRLPITEECPMGNVWWEYARKKQACEQWLRQRWLEDEFPVTIVRPSHTYSKHWIPNLVASSSYSFAARLEAGLPVFVPDAGDNPWTLTAASDFALGLAGLVGNDEALGETFHITSDEVLTWNQILAEMAAALGVDSPVIFPIPTDFICEVAPSLTGTLKGDKAHPGVFDNSKIRRWVPEFVCRKPLRVGLRESAAWLRAHPEHQNRDPQVDAICEAVVNAWRRTRH